MRRPDQRRPSRPKGSGAKPLMIRPCLRDAHVSCRNATLGGRAGRPHSAWIHRGSASASAPSRSSRLGRPAAATDGVKVATAQRPERLGSSRTVSPETFAPDQARETHAFADVQRPTSGLTPSGTSVRSAAQDGSTPAPTSHRRSGLTRRGEGAPPTPRGLYALMQIAYDLQEASRTRRQRGGGSRTTATAVLIATWSQLRREPSRGSLRTGMTTSSSPTLGPYQLSTETPEEPTGGKEPTRMWTQRWRH
jgi:hypothetical protein